MEHSCKVMFGTVRRGGAAVQTEYCFCVRMHCAPAIYRAK